jgi:hypothetical protein
MSNAHCGPPALTLSAEMADRSENEVALELIPAPAIQKRILAVRKRQVMLDEDLAELIDGLNRAAER